MAYVYHVVEWCAFLLLFFRSLSICIIAFASVNATVFFRASIQVQAGSKGAPVSSSNRRPTPDSNDLAVAPRNDGKYHSEVVPKRLLSLVRTRLMVTM